MARIAGVDLPRNKKVEYALSYIYGIGVATSRIILEKSQIDGNRRVNELSEEELLSIRKVIDDNFSVEGELRSQVSQNIKRLIDIGTYRGLRHRKGLPVRGQNTKNNWTNNKER